MARDPAANPPSDRADITIRASREYAEWAKRFAMHRRLTVAELFDHSAVAHAEASGFEPPPPRQPGRTRRGGDQGQPGK